MPSGFDDRSSSGCQEASKTPAQCLYLADPYRLAVLGIKIIAQASIESSSSSGSSSSNNGPRLSANPASHEAIPTSPSFGPASKLATTTTAAPPPSSFKSPNIRSGSGGSRGSSRPRSLELGHQAKEAILDIGRGVNHGWKNLSKSDLYADSNDATTNSASSHLTRSTSQSSNLSHYITPSNSTIQVKQENHARQVYNLRPDSLTFAAGPSAPLASTSIGLQVSSRMEVSKSNLTHESTKLQWENMGFTRTEFVRDAGPSAQGNGRAGVFSAIRKGDIDSGASEDGNDDSEEESEEEGDYQDEALDARHLLLKVSPPLQYLRRQDSSMSNWKESSSIVVKARLRLDSRQHHQQQHQLTVPFRASPAGPRTPRAKQDDQRGTKSRADIVFVSTHSSRKLFDAVESTRLNQDGTRYVGPVSTSDAARLEGIDWVPITERRSGSELVNFEWKWKEIGRNSTFQRDVFGEKAVTCACAFIELNAELGVTRVLASFTFLVAIPPAIMPSHRPVIGLDSGLPESFSDATLEVKQRRASARSPHLDGLQKRATQPASSPTCNQGLGLGLGLGLGDADMLMTGSIQNELASSLNSNKSSSRLRWISGGVNQHSPSSKYRQISNSSSHREEETSIQFESRITPLQVDHAEINLADVEEDGPILRAAIQNLERRTANLKKAAKATIKAAAEVRINLSQLQASEAILDQCLEMTAHLAPSTIGHLYSEIISKKRKEINIFRQEEKMMLQDHVEVPLLAVVDMCKIVQEQSRQFEVESKAYYSATQKWLSSRSTTAASNSANNREVTEVYSPAAVGFIDKASLKQERFDDKQRLRQSRFYLARLEVFRAVKSVHGGEAELLLASHVLALCRWHGLNDANRTIIDRFEKGLQIEQNRLTQQSKKFRIKYGEMEEMVTELQGMLGKGGNGVEGEAVGLPSSESETAIGTKTRNAGQKIKNILSTLSTNKQGNPPVPNTWTTSSGYVESPSKSSPFKSRNTTSIKNGTPSQSASATGGGATSFAKLQQKLRPTSYIDSLCDEKHIKETSTLDSLTALQFPLLDSIPVVSPFEGDFELGSSPSPRRSLSIPAESSPRMKSDSLVSRGDQMSPTIKYNNQKMGRTSSDAPRPTKKAITTKEDQQNNRMSLLLPRHAAQQSRKKEGILWAMSKAIAGAGGADAPKAVSRSQNWRECWVVLSGSGHLGQYAEWKDVKIMEPSQPLIDLRFATVREARGVERRFTFEVITRENRQFFQASNADEIKEWIAAISFAIESLLNGTSSIRQIDKVARVASGLSPFLGSGDEFGSQFRSTPIDSSALGQHRALSQSLTDLSSASGGSAVRLFHRGGNNKDESSRKRDSKGSSVIPSGHLATLSEGARQSIDGKDFPISPHRNAPWISHERGISNKTPVSGYIQESTSSVLSQSSWTLEPDYDRKIEEMVHSNYGSSVENHRQSYSLLSGATSTHQNLQMGQEVTPTSSKYSRSKEIIDISALPENNYCADCRAENPKWASWSLNGEARCIFICITCSGIHRGLGVSVSRVKSVELDDWTEEQMDSARNWGNDRVNVLYEAKKPRDVVTHSSINGQFWKEKYVNRSWYGESAKEVEEASLFKHLQQNEDKNCKSPRSPRWPSSPPVVFVSMLDEDLSKAKRRSGSINSPMTTTSTLDDDGFFEDSPLIQLHQSPTLKSTQHFSRRSLEQKKSLQSPPPPPAMHYTPGLAT